MAKLLRIGLAILVRQEKFVVVEVPDDFDLHSAHEIEDLMHEVYEQDDGTGFSDDLDWCCEEGTHMLFGEADTGTKPQFRVDDKGVSKSRIRRHSWETKRRGSFRFASTARWSSAWTSPYRPRARVLPALAPWP